MLNSVRLVEDSPAVPIVDTPGNQKTNALFLERNFFEAILRWRLRQVKKNLNEAFMPGVFLLSGKMQETNSASTNVSGPFSIQVHFPSGGRSSLGGSFLKEADNV
jgi:hypothetical protein